MKPTSCLVIVRGFPYEEGATLPIQRSGTVLGRKDAQWEPDIGFDNVFVSRKQAEIIVEKDSFRIADLDSKHGTTVNGVRLTPFVPTVLRSSDSISFAKGLVQLTFSTKIWEETMDFIPMSLPLSVEYKLDPERQTIRLQDRSYHFSDKEYRCLELLVRNQSQFVGKDEIIRSVWPERAADEGQQAVGSEEINSLLYRIRKKTNHRLAIESIRGRGYVLQEISKER